jgi:hypothetical protein
LKFQIPACGWRVAAPIIPTFPIEHFWSAGNGSSSAGGMASGDLCNFTFMYGARR